MNLQTFLQKNLFLARFLQTMAIFQESCRKRNSYKNLVKSCKKRLICQNVPRLVIFSKILQDSVRIMHYPPSFYKSLARILREMHFISTTAVNFNSQQKFYNNGASAVLRRLTAVSAELPAMLEK